VIEAEVPRRFVEFAHGLVDVVIPGICGQIGRWCRIQLSYAGANGIDQGGRDNGAGGTAVWLPSACTGSGWRCFPRIEKADLSKDCFSAVKPNGLLLSLKLPLESASPLEGRNIAGKRDTMALHLGLIVQEEERLILLDGPPSDPQTGSG